jgi:hypothetical protein
MYPITNEVKALFEAEQRKVLRITGKPLKKDNVSVGPSDIVTVNDAAAIPAKDITIGIEPVQSGSGDPSPTNVRPISGWTGANVTRTGKNLLSPNLSDYTVVSSYLCRSNVVKANQNARFTFVDKDTSVDVSNCSIGFQNGIGDGQSSLTAYIWAIEDGVIQNNVTNVGQNGMICSGVLIYPRTEETFNKIFARWDVMIELGSTATAYEPYTGTTYPISWQSEAGTVYGGKLDVTTGMLTVKYGYVDMGTIAWTRFEDTSIFYKNIDGRKKGGQNIICSNYKTSQTQSWSSVEDKAIVGNIANASIYVRDSSYTDATVFKTAMSGVQLVYELAAPQTYQLTPTDVALLLGDNNVWADTGETTLTYRPYADLIITDDNVIEDSFQIDRYSCNGEKLEVGTAIAAQMSFTLENGNGQYDGIVFEDAELFAEVGIADWTQSSPTITYVPCGYFTPDNQPRRLSTISITALDRMTLFDVVVDAADLTFPTTVAGLVGQVCTLCGVTLAQSISGLVNASVAVTELPTVQGEITYRNLIQWSAGIMGTNAWFDWNGQLRFSWYENATGYVSTVDNRYSSDLYEDDLTVSGIEYTNNSGIVIVEGTDDYAIDLTGNAIAGSLVATVLSPLNTALNGFTYRPFTAATVNAPYLWPMDVVNFTDKDGNNHTSVLTNVAFGLNGTTAMESKGMTYAINKLAQPKGFTREQAQLVNQAMEYVEQDIDESLTQQEIFNRLTDDGAAQGLVLYNGQLYINASYINAGYLNVGRIDFNDPPTYCNVPDENDVDSLLSGQTVVDGWIVNASGTGKITIISCGFALPLHGKTVSVTFEYNDHLWGGSDSWYGISDEVELVGGFRDWEMPAGQTPENPYTLDFYVDNDMQGFSMSVNCSGVRRISVSLDSPVTPTKDIVYDYRGQRIGTFNVYRDGTLETYEKSLFNGPTRIGRLFLNEPLGVDYGGTGATTPAGACAALAPGIPTAAYTLIPNSNYGPNVSGGVEPLRCVKYGNGLKRLIGLISITGNGAQDGGIICTVPTGFEYALENNGGIQGWGSITRSSGGESYLFRFVDSTVYFWGAATVPTGTYALNYLYF